MREKTYTQRVVKRLRSEGAVVFKIHGSGMGQNGIPDLYVASPVFTGWLELKTERNHPSPLQVRRMSELLETGQQAAFVLRGLEAEPDRGNRLEMPDGTSLGSLDERGSWLSQLATAAQRCVLQNTRDETP